MIKITDNRLNKIIEFVNTEIIVDVGADHGMISAELILNNKIKFAYVTDISKFSLAKAEILFKENNIQTKAEFLVGDGLSVIKKQLSNCTAIIAGIGGQEIIKIIEDKNRVDNITCFVLQPMKNVVDLRKFLINNKYKIVKDVIVFERGKFYSVLKIEKGTDILTEQELYLGRTNLQEYSKDFIEYLKYEDNKFENVLKNIKTMDTKKEKYAKLIRQTLSEVSKGEEI